MSDCVPLSLSLLSPILLSHFILFLTAKEERHVQGEGGEEGLAVKTLPQQMESRISYALLASHLGGKGRKRRRKGGGGGRKPWTGGAEKADCWAGKLSFALMPFSSSSLHLASSPPTPFSICSFGFSIISWVAAPVLTARNLDDDNPVTVSLLLYIFYAETKVAKSAFINHTTVEESRKGSECCFSTFFPCLFLSPSSFFSLLFLDPRLQPS